jgi:hypothetical protein
LELNATYLFEKPFRTFHNCEVWWTSFFTLFALWCSTNQRSFSLPTYQCTEDDSLHPVGIISFQDLSYGNVIVDGRLRGDVLGIADWPNRFADIKPDVTILHSLTDRQITFVEVKTIGASVKSNAPLYSELTDFMRTKNWNVKFLYLMSDGHEASSDWGVLRKYAQEIILWEDVLRATVKTPFEALFGEPIAKYFERSPNQVL